MARAYVALIQHEMFRESMNVPIQGVDRSEVLNIRLQDGGRIQDLYMTRLRDPFAKSQRKMLRKGIIGNYRKELGVDVIRKFDETYGWYLEKYGYETAAN